MIGVSARMAASASFFIVSSWLNFFVILLQCYNLISAFVLLYFALYPLETCSSATYMICMKHIKNIRELMKAFPDDDSCLEHIFRTRYADRFECAKCHKEAQYYRIKKRRAYECEHCGHQIYPTAGTPFENTRTPLTDWFYVMFMFTTSRNGVAAKEVQRQIGVTYKTAWRMCNRIRRYMGYVDGDFPVGGPTGKMVEVDKTHIGGYDKMGEDDKAIVLGMVERGGDVVTRIVADRRATTVVPEILRWVSRVHG